MPHLISEPALEADMQTTLNENKPALSEGGYSDKGNNNDSPVSADSPKILVGKGNENHLESGDVDARGGQNGLTGAQVSCFCSHSFRAEEEEEEEHIGLTSAGVHPGMPEFSS